MEDSRDFNDVTPQTVHDAVRPENQLAEVGPAELRNHAAGFRELEKSIGGGDKPSHHKARVLLRVGGDVVAYRLEVGDRAR